MKKWLRKCQWCSKSFIGMPDLYTHELKKHREQEEQRYVQFVSKSS